jgi:uncharacterized protein YaaR (DUF327 family)
MKVNKSSKTGAASKSKAPVKKDQSEVPRVTFTEILAIKDYQAQKDALQKVLDEIDSRGQLLIENRTVENLYAYKDMIKAFIDEVVNNGFEVKERRSFSRGGRSKVMRTVSEIDAKLVELTNLIIKREHKEINVLKKVGEIRGLLINLMI